MKKIVVLILTFLLLLIPSTIYAAHYTEEDMVWRDTVDGSEIEGGNPNISYIAQGQPVACESTATGLIAQEPFIGNDGKPYPAGTSIISVSEDGSSGTTREYSSITLDDTSIEGRGDSKDLVIDVLAEPVIDYGADGADSPTFQVQEYIGDIANSAQDYHDYVISEADRIGMTVEELAAYCGYESVAEFEAATEALFNEEYGSIISREAEYIDGKLVLKDVGDGFLAITGINAQELAEYAKLYSIQGDGSQSLYDFIKNLQEDDEEPTPPPSGQWSDSQRATASAKVWSDQYVVKRAIPTSENINGTISASDKSWSYNIVAKSDSESATVRVYLYWNPRQVKVNDYDYWKDKKGEWHSKYIGYHYETVYDDHAQEYITGTYTTHYFAVQNAQMSTLTGGSVSNESTGTLAGLPASGSGGSISRTGGIYLSQSVNTSSFSVYADSYGGAVSKAKGTIEDRIRRVAYVKNDTLNITGSVLSGQTEVGKQFGDTPYVYPSKLKSPSNRMVPGGPGTKMIPEDKPNTLYKSSASASYALVGGFDGSPQSSAGADPDDVFVHTPVVNNANITYVSPFVNQKINKDGSKIYLMLDETFKITIPDDGTHINARGYNTRTYNSNQAVPKKSTNWGRLTDIKLPFDVYLHVGGQLKIVKANTWLSDLGYANSGTSYTFTIPVWAKEGNGTIETRVIAENEISYSASSYNSAKIQDSANTDSNRYVAGKNINVEVIGKIYDLRVSSTNDPGWNSIYSWKNKTTYIAADEFPFGAQGQNRNTAYKYAPKLGYTFVFDFKTKGTKSNNIDISIQPEGFYFISRDGKTSQEVDLYYNTTTKQNIKIQPSDTNTSLSVNLREAYMKVASQEFVDSARIYNNKYNYSLGVKVGTFAKMNLPHSLRMCYNNFAEYINKLYGKGSTETSISNDAGARDTVIGSVGHWYAGYRLPASTKAIPKGSDITTAVKNNSFLTDGYILVKFDIKTKYQDATGNYDYLLYMGPEGINEAGDNTGTLIVDWTGNTPQNTTLPNGAPTNVPVGAVAIFDASLRSSNDAEVGGTH